MIKKYIYTAVLLLSAIACSKEYDNNSSLDNSIITFASSLPDTKGTPIEEASLIPSMGVIGFIDDETYINNREATKGNDGNWSLLNPVVYWPESEAVTFFTYSPYDQARYDHVGNSGTNPQGVSHVEATSTQLSLKYTTPTTCTDQPDLMVAYKENASKADGAVELNKKHALAAIGFRTYNEMWRGVDYIRIKNVVAEGTLTYKPKESNNQLTWKLEEPSNLDYEPNLLVTPDAPSSIKDYDTKEESKNIITEDGYLMMIPQNLENVEIEVGLIDYLGVTTNKTITFKSSDNWEMGQKYEYAIYLENVSIFPDINKADLFYYVYKDSEKYSHASTLLTDITRFDKELPNSGDPYIDIYAGEMRTMAGISPCFEDMPEGVCSNPIDLSSSVGNMKGDPHATFRMTDDSHSFPIYCIVKDTYTNFVKFPNINKNNEPVLEFEHANTFLSFRISNSDCKLSKIILSNVIVEADLNIKTGEWDLENGKYGDVTFNVETILPNGKCAAKENPYMILIPQTYSGAELTLVTESGKSNTWTLSNTVKPGLTYPYTIGVDGLMD